MLILSILTGIGFCFLLWYFTIEIFDRLIFFLKKKKRIRRNLILNKVGDRYRFNIAKKDLLRLPSGEYGIVINIDYLIGGNLKRARIMTIKKGYIDFYDKEINLLEKVEKKGLSPFLI